MRVENIRRVSGTPNDGVWEGRITLPIGMQPGVRALRVQVTDQDDITTVLSTNQFLVVRSDRVDLARDDTVRRAPRDTLRYFGYDIFRSIPDAFRPGAMGPIDDGYLVGPNDELRLTAWGAAQFQYDLTVDQEGRIFIPNVGQYTVSGKRLDALRTELRDWLSQRYAGLTSDPPTISMDLTVTRVRPVQVYVLGEVRYPGGYTVSSGSTVFNVLYSMGGPMRRGSLRNIQVIRDGEVVTTVDLYDYLMRGYNPNPVRLQNGDNVYIPPRNKTVAINGSVRRPAYFEVKPNETFRDLLTYAGGLKPEAYTGRVHIERIVPFDEREEPSVAREAIDFNLNEVRAGDRNIALADADFITVPSILEENNRAGATRVNAVKVTGAVFQPGQYEIDGQLRTVRDLIQEADGLRGDAYRPQAELVRLQEDLDEASRTLDLNRVMEDNPLANVVLRPGDSLHVASVQELKIERTVRITGQVLDPGTYTYRDSMTVGDLLFKGGGLTDDEYLKDVFLERADLYRESADGRSERVIPFHLGEALNGNSFAGETLRPGDQIRVYPVDVEVLRDRFVEISGAVKSPGRYEFRDNMSLKDIILQAEGFQEGAFLQAVEVTRRPEARDGDVRARTLQVGLASGSSADQVSFAVDDTAQALQTADRFQLQHRDRVYVRTDPSFQEQETITVRGEVRFPGEYTLLRENETLFDIINRAGGVRATGYPKGGRLFRDSSQVIVEMGQAIRGEEGSDVILQPGDEIVIPPQPNTVAIRGNVANEGLLKFRPGERVAYYLERAGGTLDETEGIFITQASGATFEVDRGWFRRTPQVDDGAIIRVTRKPPETGEGEPLDLAG
ncbi:MAG: sugar ABC transporter substrate-binding protein, partial [Bacteroidetes bacterium]|nr:sugar ABC transporter substrate-binding protein [Bacteroidota bacterium]